MDGTAPDRELTELPIPGRPLTAPSGRAGPPSRDARHPFVVGPENWLAAAALRHFLPTPASSSQPHGQIADTTRLIFLSGPTGCGKTHLAQGLVELWQASSGQGSAEDLSASGFRRELIEAIEADTTNEFRARLRSRRLLAIDDIHLLPPDSYLQQEFIHTLDAIAARDQRLLVTSGQPLGGLTNLVPAVLSRLSAGTTVRLSPPGDATRARLAQLTASALGHSLPAESAGLFAQSITGSTRDLVGAVMESVYTPHPSGILDAESVTQVLASRAARQRPELGEVLRVVARYYCLSQRQLKSSSRQQSVVMARAMAIYLTRQLAGLTYQQIGRALGGRDHTTIMHNYRKIEKLAANDVMTQQAVEDLRRILLV